MSTLNNDSKNILNSDVELKGTLRFSGELTFDGKLDGDINSDGTLHLGDNAVIKATSPPIPSSSVEGQRQRYRQGKIDIKSRTELFGDVRAAGWSWRKASLLSARPKSIQQGLPHSASPWRIG